MANYTETDGNVVTRDNKTLYTRIFRALPRPKGLFTKVGAIYIQCPYGLDYHATFIKEWRIYAREGLSEAMIIQETRARYNSTGEFDWFRNSEADAEDSIKWIVAQEWSNGNVIPYGVSAMGTKALLTGNMSYKPHTQNLGIFSNGLHSAAFRGGVYRSTIVEGMLVFTNQTNLEPSVKEHEEDDEWWKPEEFTAWKNVNWPAVFWGGWFDIFQKDTLSSFELYRSEGSGWVSHFHKLIVDPLGHCGLHSYTGNLNQSAIVLAQETVQVLNMALFKSYGSGNTDIGYAKWAVISELFPRYIWMVFSSEGGYMTSGWEWPKITRQDVYLISTHYGPNTQGGIVWTKPTKNSSLTWVYDPSHPTPSTGGFAFYDPLSERDTSRTCGPIDTSWFGFRGDVLLFDSEPLNQTLAITGAVSATLFVSSDAVDTDFIVRLVDVFPGDSHGTRGSRTLVTDGQVRMRWRNGMRKAPASAMVSGEVYEIEIDMWSASYIFSPGHRNA